MSSATSNGPSWRSDLGDQFVNVYNFGQCRLEILANLKLAGHKSKKIGLVLI